MGYPAFSSGLERPVEVVVFVTVLVAAIAASLAVVADIRRRLLPNRLVLLTGCAPLVAIATGAASTGAIALGAVLAAGPVGVVHLASPSALGFGDVKFATVLGAWCGVVDARVALLAVCLASGVTVAVGAVARRTDLPFGPGLLLGTVAAPMVGGWL